MGEALTREQVLTALSRFLVCDRESLSDTDASLRAQLEAQTERAELAQHTIAEQVAAYERLEQRTIAANQQVADLTAKMEASVPKEEHNKIVTETILSLDAERTGFEERIAAAQATIVKLKGALGQAAGVITMREATLQQVRGERDQLQAKLAAAEQDYNLSQIDCELWRKEARDAIAICRGTIAPPYLTENVSLKQQLAEAKAVIAKQRLSIEHLSEQHTKQGNRATQLQATVTRLEDELCTAKERIAKLNDARDHALQVSLRLVDWRTTVTASLRREGGALYEDVPKYIRELKDERDDLQATVSRLESEKHAAKFLAKRGFEELQKLQATVTRLEKECSTAAQLNAGLTKTNSELNRIVTAQQEEIGKLREALRYMSREDNWTKEDGSYQMRRPGGAQREGIFISSHFLNPWVYAREALAGGKED